MSALAGKTVAVTSGGTGGHMFPARALAAQLTERGAQVVFITDRRGARYAEDLSDVTLVRLAAGGVAGRGLIGRTKGAARLGLGLVQALARFARRRPAALVGFGGYASVPATLAARHFAIPLIIHEQNAVLGRANRLVAGRSRAIAASFPKIAKLDPAWESRLVWTGNPVRADIAALAQAGYRAPDATDTLRLLVLGGSQGARILSDVVPAAVAALPADLQHRLSISQQCRPEDVARVTAAYAATAASTDLQPFFDDIPARLGAAHLLIARAGASTVAELTAAGRPAILVPYPHAVDDHQRFNAHYLDDAGAAWLMPQEHFTAASLADRLAGLAALPETLTHAAACARNAGRADAASRLADLVEDLLTRRAAPQETAA